MLAIILLIFVSYTIYLFNFKDKLIMNDFYQGSNQRMNKKSILKRVIFILLSFKVSAVE